MNMTGASAVEYDAWLASACLPAGILRNLLERYGDAASVHRAFQLQDEEIRAMIPSRFTELLRRMDTAEQIGQMKNTMARHTIGVLHPYNPSWPDQLSEMDDPPAFLFYQGDPECLKGRCVSMVGSRAASYAGMKAARRLAENLSRHKVTVISGLASGIDASAHRGCLDGGSPTVAVAACGLDRVYPADNKALRDEILQRGGLLLSEYAPGEKPAGWHFPVRNRIIAGLGRALILIEARIRSGSMTTVQHALDQGRDVFVYPGDPSSEQFEGNHQLLREGGIYFTCAEDILSDLHWLDNPSAVRQNSDCSAEIRTSGPEQAAVTEALKRGCLSFEELQQKTGLAPSVLMGTITILQISGIIEALPGKQYQLKH